MPGVTMATIKHATPEAVAAPVGIDPAADIARPWWETRWMVALAIAAAMIPLAYPSIPPLVDLLGHMGRYRVEIDHSEWLDQYYSVHWAMVGNLGVDLLVMALAPFVVRHGLPELSVIGEDGDLAVMADPEGNEFCVEP